ncbi:hypothetical protein COV06_01090 [Candidatus Uhrbacteria bacterium CG10_big_fil_rev_8_21_14_0_10_50_16]|uniref:Uncharacterized protein n=1 Tax=Candidatus Uhrbacteria bacterium CG10_big_fil_rev_8_21_14_0_10_50_16 TaxID=1975039 RepID=A0A2H0RN95_9BACT|nr:MAG: hypothetical protein COV06_01090 [Candidatus Uhrbacteria bacterium CG10_big_fil_rev_8_21_14_0_10_50_16]
MFAITLNTSASTLSSTPSMIESLVPVVIGLLVIGILVAALFVFRGFHLRAHRKAGGNLHMRVLRVRIPRFVSSEREEALELRQVQEDIAVAETFFSALGGLPYQKGFNAWLHGRTDHIAFEMVVKAGVIYFYVATPAAMKELMVQQLHAQFPDAEVEEAEDYNMFTPTGVVLGSYVTLKREDLFPIKTYKQLESDPLYALLNALAKVPETDGAAIQVVARSAKGSWRERGLNVVKLMQEGATIKQALKGKSPKEGGSGMKLGSLISGKSDKNGSGSQEPQRQMSDREREMLKGIEDKASRAGLDVNIRILVSAENVGSAQASLNNILNSFSQYNIYQFGNSFEKSVPRNISRMVQDFIYRNYVDSEGLVLNTEELASLWHPPMSGTPVSNIDWLGARTAPAPADMPKEGILLGHNKYRGAKTPIRISASDRQRHMYFIGKSGSGKTTEIVAMAVADIVAGHGVCYVDPHGDAITTILGAIPPDRIEDVVVFAPYDTDMPVGLNMLEAPTPALIDLTVQDMISIFYKLFPPDMIGPTFEHHMRNVMLTLMSDFENPGTIAEIPRMFSDEDFQKQWVAKVKDPVVRAYWEQEMAKVSDFHKSEMLGYLISKVGRFVEDAMMRNIIGQTHSGFSFREVMDKEKILLIDLSKGKTGEVNAQLLGLVIVSKLQMAAMARADMAEELRKDFYLYIDEFQNFVTPSIATILSEARKYRLDLILAHQYMSQVVQRGDTEIRDAILGNVGSMFVSRIGPEDTDTFIKVFAPEFNANDLINSDPFTWYTKMIKNNTQLPPFTMTSLPPVKSNPELAEKIRQLARLTYGKPRAQVERDIARRSGYGSPTPPPPVAPTLPASL